MPQQRYHGDASFRPQLDEWMAGVQMLNWQAGSATISATAATAILCPFYRADIPYRKIGDDIVLNKPADGQMAFMHGRVTDFAIKTPTMEAKFRTDEDGRYSFYCLRPTLYPVLNDGPAGKLLKLMDCHPFRPAQIHIIEINKTQATHKDYRPLTTQIFDRKDQYLANDSVFAVKDSLVVDFEERNGDLRASLELKYDVKLVRNSC
ncbi:hypothetical protein CNMCM5793_009108 [Aspergillus hiratsukae]|uniref:Intradiol ring-cleavage dioxygenases domain-containing protein n=1 Tax=Aspergillus hiratsukae TaxID=1194566 RepID=A0A8H6PXT2_9EURO|nr:hypothetical protein CNMCM5793_009108 [Aspergillus hiratsukae]KAF7163231.1 hypothetical protein CNMCM6106_000219 [Aspergillus hiratsukae]